MDNKKYTLAIDSAKLDIIINKKKEELGTLIKGFKETHLKFKVDRVGNQINDTNPLLVSLYFFKSINPIGNVEPVYTSEQLSKVYDLYCYIIEQVNMEIMQFQPTISHFAKFAGMNLAKFNELRSSADTSMKDLIDQINTDIFDANMTLTQHNKLTERPTTYRMKVENEMIEKKSPSVNVNLSAKTVDLDVINKRLAEIKHLTKNRIEYEEN